MGLYCDCNRWLVICCMPRNGKKYITKAQWRKVSRAKSQFHQHKERVLGYMGAARWKYCVHSLTVAHCKNFWRYKCEWLQMLNLSLWLQSECTSSEMQCHNWGFSLQFLSTNLILNLFNYLSWFIYFVGHVTNPQGFQARIKSGLCLSVSLASETRQTLIQLIIIIQPMWPNLIQD